MGSSHFKILSNFLQLYLYYFAGKYFSFLVNNLENEKALQPRIKGWKLSWEPDRTSFATFV
jgi:hypothetical protein